MPAQFTIRMNYQFKITKSVWHIEYWLYRISTETLSWNWIYSKAKTLQRRFMQEGFREAVSHLFVGGFESGLLLRISWSDSLPTSQSSIWWCGLFLYGTGHGTWWLHPHSAVTSSNFRLPRTVLIPSWPLPLYHIMFYKCDYELQVFIHQNGPTRAWTADLTVISRTL